ncbi:hypothetical protein GGS21DRAFT_526363 [Xylaria nigripes]|nr:hypothetical protein GGS21DRAFT_526363 [Xylaria nigripes]
MSSQARDSVLLTAELLEEILLHLDMRSLFIVQRVSRQWRDLIATSPKIQRALFLRPAVPSSDPPIRNPLLAQVFPSWFSTRAEAENHPRTHICSEDVEIVPISNEFRNPAFKHPDASWRRMLVCQPPALSLGRWDELLGPAEPGVFPLLYLEKFPDGLRMDRLFNFVHSWINRPIPEVAVYFFSVFWDSKAVSVCPTVWYRNWLTDAQKNAVKALACRSDVFFLSSMLRYMPVEMPEAGLEPETE